MALRWSLSLLLSALAAVPVLCWPDGSPCLQSVFESMNPLEAAEHQGGLQLTNPPYTIELNKTCYVRNEPLEVTLHANDSETFRGFVMQPIVFNGERQGRRQGEFVRLDDNGSWQQQCFRFRDSATHSHDEKKRKIKLWWKSPYYDEDYIQFVATVAKAQREFWVKAVLSVPLPPCKIARGVTNYVRPPVTPPPPVKTFKLETFEKFNGNEAILLRREDDYRDHTPKPQRFEDAFRSVPLRPGQQPLPKQPPPAFVQQPGFDPRASSQVPQQPIRQPQPPHRQRLTHVIPIDSLSSVPPPGAERPLASFQTGQQLGQNNGQPQEGPQIVQLQNQPPRFQPQTIHFQPQVQPFSPQVPQPQQAPPVPPRVVFRPQFPPIERTIVPVQQQQPLAVNNVCVDLDTPARCFARLQYCRTHPYMFRNCRRTCHLC